MRHCRADIQLLLTLLGFCLLFLKAPLPLFAQEANIALPSQGTTITEIDTSFDAKLGRITLRVLGNAYNEPLSPDFGTGFVRVTLPKIAFSPELRLVRVSDGFIQNIRFFQNKRDVLMEIEFTDSFFNAAGKFDLSSDSDYISMMISSAEPLSELIGQNYKDTADQKSNTTPSTEAQNTSPLGAQDGSTGGSETAAGAQGIWGEEMTKLLGTTLIVLLILWLCAYLIKRFSPFRANAAAQHFQIRTHAVYPMGRQQKVCVVSINDTYYACGVSRDNISIVQHIPEEQQHAFAKLASAKGMSLGLLQAEFSRHLKGGTANSPSGNKAENGGGANKGEKTPDFAKELLHKVKKLKRIV